jgi:hypothetical protein
MERFKKIIERCKCGVYLEINPHADCYENIREKIEYMNMAGLLSDTPIDIINQIIEKDNLIDLQFYPDTPIGSYSIYHYDIEKAIDEAFEILNLN